MWEVNAGTKLIARGGNIFSEEGFLSNPDEYLQFAVLCLSDGQEIQRHVHKRRNRHGRYPTHEFFVVFGGMLKVQFYSDDKVLIDSKTLVSGDFYCQYSGGHSFLSLSEDTLFIEVKHGPFSNVEDDKIKF